MSEKYVLNLRADSQLNINLNSDKQKLNVTQTIPAAGTRNYNNLSNKPSINGVVLSGNQGLADLNIVSENTEAGWAGMSSYVPKYGEICLYSDVSKIKIGDGAVPIVDLPFIGGDDAEHMERALAEHTNNNQIHVSLEDRRFWNAKLNYDIQGEELIMTRN